VLELARRTGPTADFILAGEGPLWKRIRRQASEIGANVRVLGWTDRIAPLVHRCTLAAFPSVYREGFPRFLLEAQAAGKPVVAYDVRGSRDAVDNGQTGLLVPPADVDAFCRAAQRVLADEDLRRRLGEAGQRRVREKFSLTASVGAQLSALAVVLAKKGIHAPWS
jgi:glycosyltransferase involved in cell wall biosynthesis